MTSSSEDRAPIDAMRRPWRWLFVVYVILLEIGTHWPRLELPGAVPATDKSIHFAAFGILTILLFLTGWIRSRWVVVAIAATFSVIDEFSQSLPGLGRVVSGPDVFANLTGVASAGLWLWASSPVGGRSNLLRQRRYESIAWSTASARGFWWRAFAPAPLLGIVVAFTWLRADVSTTRIVITGSMIFGALWFAGLLLARRLVFLRTIEERRPCFTCATAVPDSPENGGRCAHCGEEWHVDQWRGWAKPDLASQRRIMLPSIIGGVFLFLLGIGFVSVVFRMQSLSGSAGSLQGLFSACADMAKRVCRLPDSVGRVADLAFLNFVFTSMFRLYRARLARWYDRAMQCESCRHNLTGLSVSSDGTIRCPECGHATTVPMRRTEG